MDDLQWVSTWFEVLGGLDAGQRAGLVVTGALSSFFANENSWCW